MSAFLLWITGQEIVFEEPYTRSDEEDTESYKKELSDDSLGI